MIKDLKSKIPVKDGNITSGIKAKNDKGKIRRFKKLNETEIKRLKEIAQ